MREILFRGKRVDSGEWLYGFYHNETSIESPASDRKITHHHIYTQDFDLFVDPETVGQYTGLKDKNGKKIFEGDILIGDIPELLGSQNLIGVVEYEESAFIIRIPNRKSWQIQKVGFCSFINYKVIGNVFDNHELLEKEEE